MPVINVVLTELDHHHLELDYAALVAAWPRIGQKTGTPTFAAWLGTRIASGDNVALDQAPLDDIRMFNAIERLVSSLPKHGFNLAYTAPPETNPATASQALAQTIVDDFQLRPQYAKRLQELFVHYLKTAKEVADAAQVGVTNRAYGALTEAHRQLTERTSASIAKLGVEKAIGRVEGATAILVGLDVMDRNTAKKRTSAFKAEARAVKKPGWVGRMFGET